MRGRSDSSRWGFVFDITPVGQGTKRPYFAGAYPPVDSLSLDAIAAIWYRYASIDVEMNGTVSYTGSVTVDGDNWDVVVHGAYTLTNSAPAGGSVEGDQFCYPSQGSTSLPTVDYAIVATITNTTTGDVWSTESAAPFGLVIATATTLRCDRGRNIERVGSSEVITTPLFVTGRFAFSVLSGPGSGDTPQLLSESASFIMDAERFTDNEDSSGGKIGTCEVALYNTVSGGSCPALDVFHHAETETPDVYLTFSAQKAKMPGMVDSAASIAITGGEVFPYGVDPLSPASLTTANRLWNPDGTPTTSMAVILNANLTTP